MEELQKRGPGRPRNPENVAPDAISDARPRPNRKPFGALEQRLAYPQRDGFHRHWFNDIPGRVARAEEAGYSHVKDAEGKNVCRLVGTADGGAPLHAYLMEIPEEWFQEDMAEQQRIVAEKEQAMKRGELEMQPGDKRYVPGQGISIRHG